MGESAAWATEGQRISRSETGCRAGLRSPDVAGFWCEVSLLGGRDVFLDDVCLGLGPVEEVGLVGGDRLYTEGCDPVLET